jgi:hypothetical protein
MTTEIPELAQPLVVAEGMAWAGLRGLARKIDLVIGTLAEAAGGGLGLQKYAFSLPASSRATSSTVR